MWCHQKCFDELWSYFVGTLRQMRKISRVASDSKHFQNCWICYANKRNGVINPTKTRQHHPTTLTHFKKLPHCCCLSLQCAQKPTFSWAGAGCLLVGALLLNSGRTGADPLQSINKDRRRRRRRTLHKKKEAYQLTKGERGGQHWLV